jgi:CRP/FNR family transcriptional regulator
MADILLGMETDRRHCPICGHRAKNVFANIPSPLLEKLDKGKTTRLYKKGQVLFYEGGYPLAVYCVCSGRVKIYKSHPDGSENIIRMMGDGELIGFRAMFSNEPFAATAQVVVDSEICIITRESLFSLLRRSPDLALDFLAKLARELRISEEQMLIQSHDTVRQRVARALKWLYEEGMVDSPNSKEITTPLKKSEIAQLAGTSAVSFSRELRYLADKGILRLAKTKIFVKNLAALDDLIVPKTR